MGGGEGGSERSGPNERQGGSLDGPLAFFSIRRDFYWYRGGGAGAARDFTSTDALRRGICVRQFSLHRESAGGPSRWLQRVRRKHNISPRIALILLGGEV